MGYDKRPLRWENEGEEPSEELKVYGFFPGDKPAADTFNYFLNNNGSCISELQTKVGDLSSLSTDDKTSIVNAVNENTASKENIENKVTSIDSSSTDTQYPSAKAVYNAIGTMPVGAQWGGITGEISNQTDLQNALGNKVDKITGKGLSAEDYTTEEKTKLASAEITSNKVTAVSSSSTNEQYPSAKAVYDNLALKVDKVEGKGLSTNDYTTAEKTKLAGIEDNANFYELPTASATVLGGVKVGDNLSITSDGILNADTGSLPIYKSTLSAGSTSVTISNSSITTDSVLSFYTSIYGVNPISVTVTTGSVTLTFDAQTTDMKVGVRVDG